MDQEIRDDENKTKYCFVSTKVINEVAQKVNVDEGKKLKMLIECMFTTVERLITRPNIFN